MPEDPELAQARVLAKELRGHAAMLTREREYTTRPEALSRLRADLEAVRRQLDRLHRRFPALAQPPESLAS
ncbi:hypothetical protein [Nocardia seriolae]|uniref:Uncharacterized protein n=1 Tax=Nocardia seriolae TaxID=37332 RepID=A0A0B8NPR2_9NOCA|nr:hypothetical protein [Nocardia seriolae]APA97986.1 hypothetical protein NS506_03937 [Nocardia seriolae]MTJ62689.1 hypothetical protein [Nocardia seriolae]MTJ74829.1 hypothetical protein [Nocardia seriolae]MTJ87726.1 hypothetical protein [Nocardia seriolae]MTK31719.1 hypothetical protein [Nocardia seriolae]